MNSPRLHSIVLSLVVVAMAGGCDSASDVAKSVPDVSSVENIAPREPSEATQEAARSTPPFQATGAVAVVNGEEILPERFNREVRRFSKLAPHLRRDTLNRYRDETTNRLIDEALIEQVIRDENIEVDEQAVEARWERFARNFETEDDKKEFLAQTAADEQLVRADLRRSLRLEAYLRERRGVVVDDDVAKKYYDDNIERFERAEQVRASHILLKLERDADETTREEVRDKAKKLARKAREEGADFAALAREHSQGPTAEKGGDLGFFERKRMVPRFSQAAFDLEPGEVSRPVLTQYGYHVIKVTDRRPSTTKPFDEVRNEIVDELTRTKTREAMRELLTELRKKAKIERNPDNIVANELAEPEGVDPAPAPSLGEIADVAKGTD